MLDRQWIADTRDMLVDYDGCSSIESLKVLIDEVGERLSMLLRGDVKVSDETPKNIRSERMTFNEKGGPIEVDVSVGIIANELSQALKQFIGKPYTPVTFAQIQQQATNIPQSHIARGDIYIRDENIFVSDISYLQMLIMAGKLTKDTCYHVHTSGEHVADVVYRGQYTVNGTINYDAEMNFIRLPHAQVTVMLDVKE